MISRVLFLVATVGQAIAFVLSVRYTSSTNHYKCKTLAPTKFSTHLFMPEMSDLLTDSMAITSSSHVLSRLFVEELKEVDPDDARSQFFFYLFAGSGAGGIGLAQIPKVYKELQELKELAQVGPSQGGEALKVGPLVFFFYSQPLFEKDVAKVISKIPSAAKISAQGTSTSYMASLGYVVQSDFVAACKGCNPYAASAVFEAMTAGKGKCVQPDDVDAKTLLYKSSLQSMLKDLQGAATTRLGAIGALAFLLFLIFDLIVESGIQAFL